MVVLLGTGCRPKPGDGTVEPTKTVTPVNPSINAVTPHPRLTDEEIEAAVLELMSNNGGCSLPCWWGIAPGKSTWESVNSFLFELDHTIYLGGYFNDYLIAYYGIPVSEQYSALGVIEIRIHYQNDIATAINIGSFEGFSIYHMSRLLEMYGQPDEVWLHTYRSFLDIDPPMDVVLLYKDQGILALYPSSEEDIIDDTIIRGCFSTSPILYLWASGNPKTFREAADTFGLDYYKWDKPIMPLKEATGMTVETFYETYRDPANDPCIETPRDLWPDP
ncbi:MAG: hypothetical protein FJZ96_11205 [Chloroflexi bacterium]|nr:hypothetical protein [Chloroflexota bacterium]